MSRSARQVMDQEFLTVRAQILDLAASLDRLQRAEGSLEEDPRWASICRALDILVRNPADRAQQIQLVFSRPYDPGWRQQFGI